MQCRTCGQTGHIAVLCPNPELDTWCGICDPGTRLIALDRHAERVQRCTRCHPLRDKLHPQHLRCEQCRAVIYRHQAGMPCDRHMIVSSFQEAYHDGRVRSKQSPATATGSPPATAAAYWSPPGPPASG